MEATRNEERLAPPQGSPRVAGTEGAGRRQERRWPRMHALTTGMAARLDEARTRRERNAR